MRIYENREAPPDHNIYMGDFTLLHTTVRTTTGKVRKGWVAPGGLFTSDRTHATQWAVTLSKLMERNHG